MSDTEKSVEIGLFGAEVPVKARGKGRPKFEWTVENSNKVRMLLAMGWNNERIASCIRDPRTGKVISVPTLKRYFRSELAERLIARDQMCLRQLEQAWGASEKGNVGAMRLFIQLVQQNDLMLAEARLGKPVPEEQPEEEVTPKLPKLGKKELNAQEADDAEARLLAELEREANSATRPN